MKDGFKYIQVGCGKSGTNDSFAAGAEAAKYAMDDISPEQISAVLVFASVRYDLKALLSGIRSIVGGRPVLGTTTAGEILNEPLHEHVVVTVLSSPYLNVRIGVGKNVSADWESAVREAVGSVAIQPFFSGNDRDIWAELTRQGKSVFGVLFSPGNTKHADSSSFEILEELTRLSKGRIPFFGGSSADDWKMQTNYILYGDEPHEDSLLVAIFETSLRFGISMDHGFTPSDKQAVATKVNGHEVVELNGKRAVDCYTQLLGSDFDELKGKHLTLSTGKPSGIRDMLNQYRINVASYFSSEGGVRFSQPVHKDSTITIMEGKTEYLVKAGQESLRKAIVRGQISRPAIGIVFSCALRQRILKDNLPQEISLIRSLLPQLPIAGFYSFGEQGITDAGLNWHSNENITVLVFGDELAAPAEVAIENQRLLKLLRQSKQKYQSMVDNIGIGVSLISKELEILELNRQMRNWFPEIDLSSKPICYRAFNRPSRNQPCHYCPTIRTLRDGQVHEGTTTTPRETNTINFRIVSSPIVNENGEVIAAIEMVEDITEKMKLEAHQKQTQKMESIGVLAGGIAHDFNNILSIIIGNNEIVADETPQSSPLHENIEEIRLAGLRARDVVRQLLTFSRQDDRNKKPLDMRLVVSESMKLIRSTIPANINIEKRIPNNIDHVFGNETQISQLLINLCVNAKDAVADSHGSIMVCLDNRTIEDKAANPYPSLVPGKYVKLTVGDTGCGMDKITLTRIFDPYFTTKEFGKGTGIGLAVAHGIVENHHGKIFVESESGKGTKFTIFFPSFGGKVEAQPEKAKALPQGDERILLIDDEPSMEKLGKQRLEKLGYKVQGTTDPEEALRMFKANPDGFDLMVTDMAMPRLTGEQLIAEIQEIRSDMPVVLCTGFSEKISEERAYEIGAQAFVLKPIEKTDFAATIRKVLDEAKTTNQQ